MSDNEFNVKLLRNLVLWARGEHARLDKKFAKLGEFDWEQENWAKQVKNGVCKTSYCMAGAAVAMNGYKLDWDDWYKDLGDTKERSAELCYPKGNKRDQRLISTTARELLGITEVEANRLFDGDNDIERIEEIAEQLCDKYGKKLKV